MLAAWEIVALALMQQRAPELLVVNSSKDGAWAVMAVLCGDLAKRGYCAATDLDVCIKGYGLTQAGSVELDPDVVGAVSGAFAAIPRDNSPTPIPSQTKQADLIANDATTLDANELFDTLSPAVIGP